MNKAREREIERRYLAQRDMYWSEGKGEAVGIATMPRTYALNAAERMLRNAAVWMERTGTHGRSRPMLWMLEQPLFQALTARGSAPARGSNLL